MALPFSCAPQRPGIRALALLSLLIWQPPPCTALAGEGFLSRNATAPEATLYRRDLDTAPPPGATPAVGRETPAPPAGEAEAAGTPASQGEAAPAGRSRGVPRRHRTREP